MDELFMWFVYLLFQVVLLQTGKALIFILSLGRWRSERVLKPEAGGRRGFGYLFTKVDGQVLVKGDGQVVVGLIFYVLLLIWLFHATAR